MTLMSRLTFVVGILVLHAADAWAYERPTGELQEKAQELADYAVREGLQGALQFCAFKDGKCVIDVWAGTMTTNAGAAKIDGNTLFPIFSTEKPILATAVHRTVEAGMLGYDQTVSSVWPEFIGGGKERLTVRELLGYRSGMPDGKPEADFTPAGTRVMADWKTMLEWFASVPPDIVPGTKQRYMARSYGWALGGTLEKVWKKPANEVLREQVLIPVGIENDFYFICGDREIPRIATAYKSAPFESMNNDLARRSFLPSAWAVSNARALAQFYNRLCGFDGRPPLLKKETLDGALKPCRHPSDPLPDEEGLKKWHMIFGMGYGLWGESNDLSRVFGHGGVGGSEALCDRSQRIAVGYTCNFDNAPPKLREAFYSLAGIRWRYWNQDVNIQDLQMATMRSVPTKSDIPSVSNFCEWALPGVFEPGSKVLFQGDSITHGMHLGDMNHVYGHGYACEIASRYQAYRPEDRLEFANRGVGGDTSSSLVGRWGKDAFPYEITENGYEGAFGRKKGEKVIPDCVSLLIGINDYFHFIRKTGLGVSAEVYEANLRKLVADAKAVNPDVKIVLCEPFRIPTDASPEFCRRQDMVAKLAAELDCAFVPFQKLFAEDLLKLNPNPQYWFWDFFHPTPAGHMKMADFWIESVDRRVRRTVRNTALEPRAKLEDDSYDWYARHERIVKDQAKIDPEIVFIGDSITHGWEANDELRGDAAACFRKWFGKYRTLNMGFGWDRIQNVLWRLSHGEMDGTKPRVVVIHIGTNNMAPGCKHPFPANTAEEIAEGIVEVCRRVREKAPSAKIVLMDVFPRGGKDQHWRKDVAEVNVALGPKVEALADANLVRVSIWDKYVGPDGEIPKELMFDSLHPMAKGYDIWGAALQPIIREEIVRPVPNCAQVKRIREGVELYGIVHWGLNTFTDREWGFGDENPADLNPAKFDAEQIVGACKAGGLQGLIVVAKHHDGFCLWPTKTTGHNISKSPFRGGKGDYVKEMEQACRKFGLKFGVYVSPWDRNNALYGTEKYVTDVFQAQIRELLSGDYGEIFEMWFDGANGGDGYYGGAREKRKIPFGYYRYETETFAMVRKLQPNVCIFNESDLADFRFGGNEQGIVDPDSRSTGGHYDGIWDNYKKWANAGLVNGTTFHPIEADFPLRPGWFYHAKERGKTKNAAYLMQRYLATVGNAATLNLGIAPNREGMLGEEDVKALRGFGTLRSAFFSKGVDPEREPFNVVVMREDVERGEQVDDWRLEVDGRVVASGRSIGIKRIRVLDSPVLGACKVVAQRGTESVKVKASFYAADVELVKLISEAATESGETDTAKWMTKVEKERKEVSGNAGGPEISVEGCAEVRIVDDVVTVTSTGAVSFARIKWAGELPQETKVLNDAWERSYGDLEWKNLAETRLSPWYYLANVSNRTWGVGVETGPGAMCCWEVTTNCTTLVLDLRAGGQPVRLGGRTLTACRLVRAESREDESAWDFGRRFCKLMCPKPKLPKAPVYGYNDWYCAYGENTATNFLADASCIMECAKGCVNPPYLVLDDGWQKNSPPVVGESGCGPWDAAGPNFGMDMPTFCRRIAALGAKPGLWYRPLRAWDGLPEVQRLLANRDYLDPTVSAVKSRIAKDMVRFRDWGFKLVKIDFLSYDLAQIWPCDKLKYADRYIQDDRAWRDCSRTTAEVMLDLYQTMKDAVGDDVVIIGCNAFNHLAAGVFELQRTGNDTSGKDWNWTLQHGVNTLAMRSIQDGAFFKIDADCAGLAFAGALPWRLNRQWIDLLSRSGTPFFVSWSRSLMDDDVRTALKAAFAAASQSGPTASASDWMETPTPRQWSVGAYNWK